MSDKVDTNQAIRTHVLCAQPEELGITPAGPTWGVLMEIGYFAGTATLIALADGTASLLFSTGGGIAANEGQHAAHRVARELVSAAGEFLARASSTDRYPYPRIGRVRFYLLTTVGVRTLDAEEGALELGEHELSSLFRDGHRVITELRQIAEAR